MPHVVLFNPKGRRRVAAKNPRKPRRAARRRNPMPAVVHRRAMSNPRRRSRRVNPFRHHARRRRNPIGRDFMGVAMAMFKEAGLGAVGSTLVNAGMSFVKPSLPVSLQSGMSYSAVKALATVALAMVGKGGTMRVMAQGALTCQLSQLLISQLGTSLPTDGSMAGLGYYTPGVQVRGGAGSQLLPRLGRLNMYQAPGGNLTGANLGGTVDEMQNVYR